jgi:hypothetical protein
VDHLFEGLLLGELCLEEDTLVEGQHRFFICQRITINIIRPSKQIETKKRIQKVSPFLPSKTESQKF